MTQDLRAICEEVIALGEKAAPGKWGIEEPMAPEVLSIVANPEAQVYDWLFVCNLNMPDEDDHDFTSAQVKANAAFIAHTRQSAVTLAHAVKRLLDENARLLTVVEAARAVVDEQSDDDGLWCIPGTIVEDVLQKALRRLHEAVEGKSGEECANEAIESWRTQSGSEYA